MLVRALCLAAVFGLAVSTPINTGHKRPNIVFILGDDCGYGDFGSYPRAKEGLRFTDAYTGAPVCAPSRCTIVTGRHSGHCTVRSNGPTLAKGDPSVAAVLKDAGYKTWHVGKWGLSGPASAPAEWAVPTAMGFDHYYGQLDQANCHNYYPSLMWRQDKKTTVEQNAHASVLSCGDDHAKCAWSGDLWTNETMSLLDAHANDPSSPFFLYLAHTTPHAGAVGSNVEDDVPIPRVSAGPYAKMKSEWPKVEVDYASAITELDRQVGLVVDKIDALGLSDETVVLFACDNGPHNEGGHDYTFFDSNGPLQGFKRSLHEGGHRTPLIIRWPSVVQPGRVTDYQATFYDFMATFADLAGVAPSSLNATDGISFADVITGQGQDQRPFVYHEYCDPNEHKNGWGQAVRIGNWSALCIGDEPKTTTDVPVCKTPQLFNLADDPSQSTDVASSHSDIVEQMIKIMKEQHVPGNYCGHA